MTLSSTRSGTMARAVQLVMGMIWIRSANRTREPFREWARTKAGLRLRTCLEDRPRYTPTSTFGIFPFPDGLSPNTPAMVYADDPRAAAIANAARRLIELRHRWLNPPERVDWVDEPVPRYPKRPVPRYEAAAAKELKAPTLTNLYNVRRNGSPMPTRLSMVPSQRPMGGMKASSRTTRIARPGIGEPQAGGSDMNEVHAADGRVDRRASGRNGIQQRNGFPRRHDDRRYPGFSPATAAARGSHKCEPLKQRALEMDAIAVQPSQLAESPGDVIAG